MSWLSTILGYSPATFIRLGEASGLTTPFTAADASGNGRTGTYSNNASIVTGVTLGVASSVVSDAANKAATFASGGKVSVADAAALKPGAGDFTLMFAVKTTTSGLMVGLGKYSGAGDSYWLGLDASSNAIFSVGAGSIFGSTALNDGNWHLVIGTRASGVAAVYVDGALVAGVANANNVSPAGNLVVGNFGDAGGFQFVGSLDEVAYLPSGLSASDVTAIYSAWSAAAMSMAASPSAIDPHTAGITITLTGTGTSWSGGTTFSVSGVSGTSKTAQSVTNSTSASITVTTGTTAGTLTISDGTNSTTVTVSAYKKVSFSASGVSGYVWEPASYDGSTAVGMIFYHHGSGETRDAWDTDSLKLGIRDRLLSDGYLLAGISAFSTTHWGNPSSISYYALAHPYLLANWNVTNVVLMAQSMGGASAFQVIRDSSTFHRIRGVYSIYAACDILACYDDAPSLQSAILAAWGAANRTALIAAIAGHNPTALSAVGYPNIRYKFHASAGDTLVLKSHNTDAMRTLLGGTTTVENTLVTTSGDHGDPSNFDADDASAFMASCLAPPTLTTVTVDATGLMTTNAYDEVVSILTASEYSLHGGAAAVSMTSPTGAGDDSTWVFTNSRVIYKAETLTLNYAGTGTVDTGSQPLATITGKNVVNTSAVICAVPLNLAVVGGNTVNNLSWTPNTEIVLQDYRIYHATTLTGSYSLLATVSGPTFAYQHTGLTNGDAGHYYKITSRDTANNESAKSAAVQGTPAGLTVPTGLVATAGSASVVLVWDAIDPAGDGVRIERSTDGITFTAIHDKSTDGTTYTDTTVVVGTAYWYEIRSFTSSPAAQSDPSNISGPVTPTDSGTTASNLATYNHIDLYRGDDYSSASGAGRTISFTYRDGDAWPDTISSAKFTCKPTQQTLDDHSDAASLTNVACVVDVPTGSGRKVTVPLTATETAGLQASLDGTNGYRFWVIANGTTPATLRSGTMTVRPDPTAT